MPSWVALVGSLLVSVVVRVFGFPLLWLQSWLAHVGSATGVAVVQLLRAPFARVAALLTLLAVAVQTAVLLEEYGADQLGAWLNGVSSSSSAPNGTTPRGTPAQLAHLAHLTHVSYPSTLSALLDDALALPTPSEGTVFSAEDVQEWDAASAAFRAEYVRAADEVARSWVDVLEYVPPAPAGAGAGADTDATRAKAQADFLAHVADELAAVQARAATRAVYAPEALTDAEWAVDAARRAEKARREADRLDAAFEAWLAAIIDGAVGAGTGAAKGEGESEGEGEGEADAGRRITREMLDHPVDATGAANGGTWRAALRASWDGMYAPGRGGVLGDVEQSLRALMGGDDGGDGEEDAPTAPAGEWVPTPLPLMANHFVRSEVASAIAAARRAAGLDRFAFDAQDEAAVLPAGLDHLAPEALSLAQRTVAIDRRARSWASAVIALVSPSSSAPAAPAPEAEASLDGRARARAALLRASPLARFLRAAEALFALPRQHLRLGVSAHEVAQAVFAPHDRAIEVPAWRRRGPAGSEERVGGCSAVALERARRAVGAGPAADGRTPGATDEGATARDEL
ncbi:hypothetical protein JCM3770_002685 [Rhodotorula araucariae]